LFDTKSGGQNPLATSGFSSPPGAIPGIAGLQLDAGFAPDYILFVNACSGTIYADHYTLATPSGGTKRYLGSGTVNDLDGFLSGGSNTHGLEVALNNSNKAGVTSSSAAGAATATSGFELAIPYADLGLAGPSGTVRLLAMLIRSDGKIGNQLLPGVNGPAVDLGYVPLDFGDLAGPQYVTIKLDPSAGDWDGDGDVDLTDYAAFAACQSPPLPSALAPGCSTFDRGGDLDVDLADFAALQRDFAP
jgi:hypothetical protein